jgi:hypothetical protein
MTALDVSPERLHRFFVQKDDEFQIAFPSSPRETQRPRDQP